VELLERAAVRAEGPTTKACTVSHALAATATVAAAAARAAAATAQQQLSNRTAMFLELASVLELQ
jgi:hypothetical protein